MHRHQPTTQTSDQRLLYTHTIPDPRSSPCLGVGLSLNFCYLAARVVVNGQKIALMHGKPRNAEQHVTLMLFQGYS